MVTKLFSDFPSISDTEWLEKIEKDLKGKDPKSILTQNIEYDLKTSPYYRKNDLEKLKFLDIQQYLSQSNKLSTKSWEICQMILVEDWPQSFEEAKKVLEWGARALHFIFKGEWFSPSLWENFLKDLSKECQAIHFTCDTFLPSKILDSFLEIKKTRDLAFYWNDALVLEWLQKSYRKESLSDTLERHKEFIQKCPKEYTDLRTLGVSNEAFHLAYANEDLAYLLSYAHEYVYALGEKGISIEKIANSIFFDLHLSGNFFVELARIRSLRVLWPRILQEYSQDTNTLEIKTRIHCSSGIRNQARYDSYNNLLRSSTESMSAILGGADSFMCFPFDYSLAKKGELGKQLAIQTQLLHQHESYLDKVIDPGAGSYYIETLTDLISKQTWESFQNIEKEGGLFAFIKKGKLQKIIYELATKKKKDFHKGKKILLGVNAFPSQKEDTILDKIQKKIINKEIPVKERYEEIEPFISISFLDEFENLRIATERHVVSHKESSRPKINIFNFGNSAIANARSIVAQNIFRYLAYEIVSQNFSLEEVEKVYKEKSIKKLIVICASDEDYPSLIDDYFSIVKENSEFCILALVTKADLISDSRIYTKLYQGMDLYKELKGFQEYFGVKI